MAPSVRHLGAAALCAAALILLSAGSAAAATDTVKPPHALTLTHGWEERTEQAAPGLPQEAPPEETEPDTSTPTTPLLTARASKAGPWHDTTVPSVFSDLALPNLYAGEVRRYRVRFKAPETAEGFKWLINFEEVRRSAKIYLNGKLIGRNSDPYTPFTIGARGLKPGKTNRLVVVVDSRKDPRLPEGWWNWGGIVRPVHLIPAGRAHLSGLGWMSRVFCTGPASGCRAKLLLDFSLQRGAAKVIKPRLKLRLRSPSGRLLKKTFKLAKQRGHSRHVTLTVPVKHPQLWAPDSPQLYSARLTVMNGKAVQETFRRKVGLRSVKVKRGRLLLNNRPVLLRGASIHEDMPGHGAALTNGAMNRIVRDLQAVGANVTRAHYLLNGRLLSKLDRAGIMVWNEAPIWQRDHAGNLLRFAAQRARAYLTVRRTVKEGRSHPSVITHSVANELSFSPDRHPGTKRFLTSALVRARAIDPTLPISVDIKSRSNLNRQSTYARFDMLGLNQYFGWYPWVADIAGLEPYLLRMRRLYPKQALVMTEFGAEALPSLADAPATQKGSYAFQANLVDQTLDVVDRSTFLSGAIYWTLREFEVFPGWTGGVPKTPESAKNTRHDKGLITYDGVLKPAWLVARAHFEAVPDYRLGRR